MPSSWFKAAAIAAVALCLSSNVFSCSAKSKLPASAGASTRPTQALEPNELIDQINHGFPIDRNAILPPTDLYQTYPPTDYPERYYLNLPAGRSEVYGRLTLLHANRRFRPGPNSLPQLLECMRNPGGELAGRLCAASLLLDAGNDDARQFLKTELASANRPTLHNAADAIAVHVLRGGADQWSVEMLIALVRDDRLLAPYAARFGQNEAFSFEPTLYFSFAFDAACEALGASKSPRALSPLLDVLKRYPRNQYARHAVENLRQSGKR